MPWTTNPVMEWSSDGGSTWTKISDHGRAPLDVAIERIETKQRMGDGTLRRYTVAKKRTWSTSWENIPDKNVSFLANGQSGIWMENFHNTIDGSFLMRLRAGSDVDINYTGGNGTVVEVMISDFSKNVTKRGKAFDLWNMSISLEEC